MLTHNSYFDDQVQSVAFERNGRKASVGVIVPGSFHFGTEAAERMTIVSGECSVKKDGFEETISFTAGTSFEVKKDSGFSIACVEPVAYLCEYL